MTTKPTAKGFKQISLPVEFLDELTKAADLADRSVPKQIEHCFKITQGIEQILPDKQITELKAKTINNVDLLKTSSLFR